MIVRRKSRFACVVPLLLLSTLSESVDSAELPIKTIEVFATGTLPTTACYLKSAQAAKPDCQLYSIDGIERLQTEWSQGLPNHPAQAKQVALSYLQSLNPKRYRSLENAAKGLLKALEYGLDRYPAMVFDNRAVVYGVRDVEQASGYYRQWRSKVND